MLLNPNLFVFLVNKIVLISFTWLVFFFYLVMILFLYLDSSILSFKNVQNKVLNIQAAYETTFLYYYTTIDLKMSQFSLQNDNLIFF